MMIDLARPSGVTAPAAFRRKKSDSANPPSASPPTLRKLRRDTPSQNRSEQSLKNVNMGNRSRTHWLCRAEDNPSNGPGQEKAVAGLPSFNMLLAATHTGQFGDRGLTDHIEAPSGFPLISARHYLCEALENFPQTFHECGNNIV